MLTYLMCPAYEIQVVSVKEFAYNIHTKCEGNTTVILTPTCYIFVWIWPQQVTK